MNKKLAKVLVIDDEDIVLEMMVQKIASHDYEVLSALDGEQAWEIIQENQPDVILTDLHIPKLDGFELIQNIRNKYSGSFQPRIIVITGYDRDYLKDHNKVLDMADGFLQKPCDFSEILGAIESVEMDKIGQYKITDKDKVKILIVDDNEGDQFLMKDTLKSEGFTKFSVASSGQEGLEKARTENPDIIILDTILPDIQGIELCRLISQLDENRANIIIITGHVSAIDVLGVKRAGGYDSVIKTPDYGFLIQTLKTIDQ
ncbi:MAG: response regulator [Candidatus Omnitrophota bacterium]